MLQFAKNFAQMKLRIQTRYTVKWTCRLGKWSLKDKRNFNNIYPYNQLSVIVKRRRIGQKNILRYSGRNYSAVYSLTRSGIPSFSATLRLFSMFSSPMQSTTVNFTFSVYFLVSAANFSIASKADVQPPLLAITAIAAGLYLMALLPA